MSDDENSPEVMFLQKYSLNTRAPQLLPKYAAAGENGKLCLAPGGVG